MYFVSPAFDDDDTANDGAGHANQAHYLSPLGKL